MFIHSVKTNSNTDDFYNCFVVFIAQRDLLHKTIQENWEK